MLEGGTLADIATAASELTGKPCAIHDAASAASRSAARPAAASPASVLDEEFRRLPGVEQALAGLKPNRPVVVDAVPGAGLLHRFLVARVVLHGKAWGYLAVMEFGSRFTALDLATSRHAATAIAIELSVERRATAADRQARESLVRDLVNGLEDHAAIVRRRGAAELLHGQPARGLPARGAGRGAPLATDAVERAYAQVAPGGRLG